MTQHNPPPQPPQPQPPPHDDAALSKLRKRLIGYARYLIANYYSQHDDRNAWAQELAQEELEFYLGALQDPERTIASPYAYLKKRMKRRMQRIAQQRADRLLIALDQDGDPDIESSHAKALNEAEHEIYEARKRARKEAREAEVRDDVDRRLDQHGQRLRAALDAVEPHMTRRGKAKTDYFAVALLCARDVGYRKLLSGVAELMADYPEVDLIDPPSDILRFVPWHLPEHERTLHRDRSGDPLHVLWCVVRDAHQAHDASAPHSVNVPQALAPHVHGGLTRDCWHQWCRRARKDALQASDTPAQRRTFTDALRQRKAPGASS